MPNFEETRDMVFGDIQRGIGDIFEPLDGDAISVQEDLAVHLERSDAPAAAVAVPWVYRCRHVGIFQRLFPTNRELEMHGVTFVDFEPKEPKDEQGSPVFHRYIDWLGVLNQLGITVNWRVPVDEDQYREGRRIMRDWPPDPEEP